MTTFPNSFQKRPHPIFDKDWWVIKCPEDSSITDEYDIYAGQNVVSIVKSDVIDDEYEMLDFRMPEDYHYMTIDQINHHLSIHPVI